MPHQLDASALIEELENARRRVLDLSPLGSELMGSRNRSRLEARICTGRGRPSFVDEEELKWLDQKQIMVSIRGLFKDGGVDIAALLQAAASLIEKAKKSGRPYSCEMDITEYDDNPRYIRGPKVRGFSADWRDPNRKYFTIIDEDAARVRQASHTLHAAWKSVLHRSLQTGRVIAFEATGGAFTMLTPGDWEMRRAPSPKERSFSFLISSQIGFIRAAMRAGAVTNEKVAKEERAKNLLRGLYQHLSESSRRPSKKDLRTVFTIRLQISESAFDKRVWPDAAPSEWRASGTIPEALKISKQEIVQILDTLKT